MTASLPPLLAGWSTFFATMCTSDAALIGLMFVVITLVSGMERTQPNPRRSLDLQHADRHALLRRPVYLGGADRAVALDRREPT